MGEVYRARDTRLDRTVAVKILPPHLAENSEAKQRFEREARTISSLNHPHICSLFDVGNEGGTAYLVMEFVQGETLEQRLRKGPLPLKQALECAVQICDALDKAHRAGIVHRDLKPGNIMLTPSGAKLLDFGLAKPITLISPAAADPNLTPSTPTMNISVLATRPEPLTQLGSIVGTFQFMAPEVFQGKEADARSDIFSLGCVLYEMITGRRAFEGKSQLSVASAILEKDPEPVSKVQPLAPGAVDHVVQECLAKDPETRWQNAADIARELRWIASSASTNTATVTKEETRKSGRERFAWIAAVVALLAVAAWLALHGKAPAPVLRSYLTPPPDTSFDFVGDFSGPPALAPDGSAVAYCVRTPKERGTIWVQPLHSLAAIKLEGTEGAAFPFWSADGKYLGFFADGRLKKIPSSGGPVSVLADAPNPRGGAWNQDNVILYEPSYREPLWRVSASGGTPTQVTRLDSGKHTTHRWPSFLPDGQHFLFFATSHAGNAEQGVFLGSLADGSYRKVLDSDAGALYANGYLLFHVQSQLQAQKFDPSNGNLSGEAFPIANLVEHDAGTWHATFTVSQTGLLIYEPGRKSQGIDLQFVDPSGKVTGTAAERAYYKGAGRFSPDGKRLAISEGEPQADIWVHDFVRGTRARLTFGGATHMQPTWSPDGQKVAYVKQGGATPRFGTTLCARLANGGGQEEVLLDEEKAGVTDAALMWPQWSPDGKYLLYMAQSGPTGASIWALPLSDGGKPIRLVEPSTPQARIVQYRLSNDGRWLSYSSTESGREEVYVTHFPDGKGRWQVSQDGGTFPNWRNDSKMIWFLTPDQLLYTVAVEAKGDEFQVRPAQSRVQVPFIAPLGNPYEAQPDGKRFVVTMLPPASPTPLVLVNNWLGEVKK
jgi:serine/threonine protein kinase